MIKHIRGGGRLPLKAFALLLGASLLSGLSARAQDGGPVVAGPPPNGPVPYTGLHLFPGPESFGTLGYGPPGLQPGYQGFSLNYHLGNGYGNGALGVGADGGYPFYGGPGYPHPAPHLRRIGGIVPFHYFGGPGYPTPDCPNFYGGSGPLVPDRPVVTIVTADGRLVGATDYGNFTGAVADAEAKFAPFTARAAAGVSSSRSRYSSRGNTLPTGPDDGSSPPRPVPNPCRAIAPTRRPHVNSSASKQSQSWMPRACGA